MPGVVRRAIATAFAFDANAVEKWLVPKSKERSPAIQMLATSRLERARPMPVILEPRGLIAMSQLEEAVARLTQARSKLAPITERLLDIETRLAVVKAAVEPPAKFSLREFTFNL